MAQHNGAAIIEADDVERVLTDINADYGNRSRRCRRHAPRPGAPGQLIAGGAGARPDHPISGHSAKPAALSLHAYQPVDEVSVG